MKKIKFLALLMLVGLVSVSCNDVLDDNVNPDRAHVIDAKDGLPVIIYYAQQIVYDHSEYYAYFSQMLTTGGKSSVGAYSYKCEWEMLTMNRHPMWRRHFYDIGKNTLLFHQTGTLAGNKQSARGIEVGRSSAIKKIV